ncbi:MAG: tyrosine-type recombinase/integrase [Methanomassiliicoccales archaeon]|nr:MAG: tyrosine-type recombinase/integrase [Methanomassiliicoccales archaeon]
MLTEHEREWVHAKIEGHLEKLARRGRVNDLGIKEYRRELWRMTEALKNAGLHHTPAKIGEREIDYIINEYAGHLKVKTRRWYVGILSGYLRTYGNHVVEEMHLGWPKDSRVRVDWLSLEEAVALMEAAEGPERLVIHLELRLMMRRCEVKRLTVRDVKEGVLDVRGKGRYGGKWRTLAWANETTDVLREWEETRTRMVEEALSLNPNATIPQEFLIYSRNRKCPRLSPYSDAGIDKLVANAARRAGITRSIGNHTLRRSGARFVIQADPANMPVLVDALGHESETQTRRYCAMTIDDMARMHASVSDLLRETKERMRLTGAVPRPPSGRIVA